MMSFHIFLLKFTVLSFCLNQVKTSPRVDPLVNTTVGLIQGVRASDGDYSKFLGIPYAQVQSNNHFGTSIPYPPFEDVFLAQNDSSVCPQMQNSSTAIGDIDCLQLNVYVPSNASSSNKLPVMVFIHGGSFTSGYKRESKFGPKFLVRHDVILVVMNYRLGVYGFMCLDDQRVPGNQGLKDQRLALKWVKENIEAFGGDAEKVTVCGQSAGAASVDLHTLTDQESLFQKAIMQSGTSLTPWTTVVFPPDREAAIKLAQAFGFDGGNNTEETLSYLSSINSHDVIAKAEELGIEVSPCVENKYENVEIFIDTDPINMKAENATNIPILIGTNYEELSYIYQAEDLETVGDIFLQRLNETFYFDDEKLTALANIARRYYIGDEEITNVVRTNVTYFDSDFIFNHPTQRSIEKYLKNGGTIFYYIFSYIGNRNYNRVLNNVTGGASHSDELGYLYDMELFSETPDETDQLMIDRMTTLWTNFIKFGEPTPETSDLLPNEWTPVVEGRLDYLTLDTEVQMKNRPFRERMAFWDLYYYTHATLQKGYDASA